MIISPRVSALCLLLLAALACRSSGPGGDAPRDAGTPAPASAPGPASQSGPVDASPPVAPASGTPPASIPPPGKPRIVAFGHSFQPGPVLSPDQAFPAVLQRRLDEEALSYEVVNAGVSGDTSAGGLRRLDWALEGNVRILIVALGGNDALRGLPVEDLRNNLSTIIGRAQARQIRVILAGMEAPPNYGPVYARTFHQVFPDVARQYKVAFLPFLLQGVAGVALLNQPDGIHPTAEGARMVADNIWAVLQPMVKRS